MPLTRRRLLGGLAGGALAGTAGALGVGLHLRNGAQSAPAGTGFSPASGTPQPVPSSGWTFERQADPARTVVRGPDGGQLACFTDGARTALLKGPTRTWTEPRTTTAVIESDAWVRVLPDAWQDGREQTAWFKDWFPKTLADRSDDVFGIAMQYTDQAPDQVKDGVRIAGKAHFGPVVPGESPDSFHYHDEKSDFYDYLGIPWTFPDGKKVQPEKERYGDLDCSGYMRMVYGYRLGIPLRETNDPGPGLPRRAFAIAQYGPGVVVVPDQNQRASDLHALQPGDLVFFAINIGKPIFIDHCGMYLGLDTEGHPRFLSSRSQANGPTFGDLAGVARLDGSGFYAEGFRTARRL